jgi:hypothetical protein
MLHQVLRRPEWHARAACRGQLATFFREGSGNRAGLDARKICKGVCPVRVECAQYADKLAPFEMSGVWAGYNFTTHPYEAKKRLRAWLANEASGGTVH